MIPLLIAALAVQADPKITEVDPFIAIANCTLTRSLGAIRSFDYALKRQDGKWINDLIFYGENHASLGKLSLASVIVGSLGGGKAGETIISIRSAHDFENTNVHVMTFIKVFNKQSKQMEAAVRMMSNTSGSSNVSDARCNVTLFEFAEGEQ